MRNQTAFLTAPRKMEIVDTKMPVAGPGEVVIEVKKVGICGSDMGFFVDPTSGGRREVTYPIVLGHECAGVVVETGQGVHHLKPGDLVAVEPGVPCGHCAYCRSGRYNLCPEVDFLAAPPFRRGAMQRYMAHAADFAYKLPEGMSALDGAMLEPFSIGMHAIRRAGMMLGDTAVIIGAGCIGLMCLMACRAAGASQLIVSDVFDNRLETARKLGATCTVNSSRSSLAAEVLRLTAGQGADHVLEAAGVQAAMDAALAVVRRGGKIVEVGLNHTPAQFDFYEAARKECNLVSVWRYANIYPLAIETVRSGKADPKTVVNRIFPFEKVQEAFEDSLGRKQEIVKAAIDFGE